VTGATPQAGVTLPPRPPTTEKPALTSEQLAAIERNRMAALARKRNQLAEASPDPEPSTSAGSATASESSQKSEDGGLAAPDAVPAQEDLDDAASEAGSGASEDVDFLLKDAMQRLGEPTMLLEASDFDSDSDHTSNVSFSSSSDSESDADSSSSSESSRTSSSTSSASSDAPRAELPEKTQENAQAEGLLSEEQRERIARNRMLALERKQQRQAAAEKLKAEGLLSEQQRESIARNRLLAIERRRQRKAMAEKPKVPLPKAPRDRDSKQALVAKLLCRWWYVLPPWPPENDAFYEAGLEARRLRCVPVEAFHTVPEVDERGRTKVFALSSWKGLFRDPHGNLVDLRPVEGRPSFDQMMLKSEPELHRLVVSAYENQLAELEAQPCRGPQDEDQRRELRQQVREVKHKAAFALTFMPKATKAA